MQRMHRCGAAGASWRRSGIHVHHAICALCQRPGAVRNALVWGLTVSGKGEGRSVNINQEKCVEADT